MISCLWGGGGGVWFKCRRSSLCVRGLFSPYGELLLSMPSLSKIFVGALLYRYYITNVLSFPGTNIYSGGYECVLAKWRYETTSKDTLPRLGSPIRAIVCSKDNNFIATCHDSNGEYGDGAALYGK